MIEVSKILSTGTETKDAEGDRSGKTLINVVDLMERYQKIMMSLILKLKHVLQHSNIRLTWDEDEPNRKALRRNITDKHVGELTSTFCLKPARSEDSPSLADWERVYLPIDPGVVLLDIAFVPDDVNHGGGVCCCYWVLLPLVPAAAMDLLVPVAAAGCLLATAGC